MKHAVFASLIAISLTTSTSAQTPTYKTDAPIAYMTDLSSGAVLFEKDADRQIPPASMAKIMTVYVAFDLVKKGEIKLDDKFTVQRKTWEKWNNQGSSMFLPVGDKVSVRDLLHGIVTMSGNDACVVLADGIAGNEEAFVQLMNKKAKELGMTNSRFGNSNGWPDEGRTVVTARDLGILSAATLNNFPKLYDDFYGQKEFRWNNITQHNRNPLLGKVDGADGLKTGHTEEAGYGFAGSAKQKDRRLVMVLAGLDSYNGRIDESVEFMNWGFANWKSKSLFKQGSVIANAPVQLGSSRSVNLIAPRNMAIAIPRAAGDNITMKVVYNGPIKAPFKAGDTIAQLVINSPDMKEQSLPLAAAETVEDGGFFSRLWAGFMSIFGG